VYPQVASSKAIVLFVGKLNVTTKFIKIGRKWERYHRHKLYNELNRKRKLLDAYAARVRHSVLFNLLIIGNGIGYDLLDV